MVCTFECPDPEEKVKGSGVCAIDLGVENIAAIVSSKGDCWLYKAVCSKKEPVVQQTDGKASVDRNERT